MADKVKVDPIKPITKISVRLPEEQHLKLVKLAKENTRSINGQIISLIKEAK